MYNILCVSICNVNPLVITDKDYQMSLRGLINFKIFYKLEEYCMSVGNGGISMIAVDMTGTSAHKKS